MAPGLSEELNRKRKQDVELRERSLCQKCLEKGHWTYECKGKKKILKRPTKSQILKNIDLKAIQEAKNKTEIQEKNNPKSKNEISSTSDSESDSSGSSSSSSSSSESSKSSSSEKIVKKKRKKEK